MHWKTALATALCATAGSQLGLAQVAPPVILQVETANQVIYLTDTLDLSKYASGPITTSVAPTFSSEITLADIVAVNGKPAQGAYLNRTVLLNFTATPLPGQAIADMTRGSFSDRIFEIHQADGTPIGSIMSSGLGEGSTVPGALSLVRTGNIAITGGTGAFLK